MKDLINILIEEAERKLGHKIEGIYDLLKLAAVTFDMVNGKDTMAQFLMKRQVFTPEPNNSTVVRVKQKFSPLGYRDLVIEIIQRAAARFGKDLFEGPNAAGNYTVDQKAFRKMLDSRDHRSVLKDDILARINETMAEIRKTIGGNEDSVSKVSMDNLRKVNEIVSQFGIKDLIKKVRNYMLGKEEETAFIDEIKALITDGYKQVTDLELKLYTKIITAQIERPTIHGTVKETVEFRLKDLYNVIAEELKLDENASFHSLLGIAIDEWDLQGLVSEEEFKNRRTVNLGDLTIEKLYENPTEDFDTKVLMLDNLDVVADGNRFAQASMMMAASMAVMESSSMRVASDSMMVADVAYEMPVVSYKRRPVYWWNPTPEVPKGTPSIFAKAELIARLLQKFSASVAKNGQIAVETFRKELRRSDSDRVREFVDKTVKEALREIARIGGVTKNTVQWHAFAKVIKAANGTKEAIESYLRLYNPDRFDYAERSEISTNANESFTKLVNLVDFTLGFDTATNTHKKDIIVTLGKAEVRLTVDALNELVRTAIEKRRAARVDDLLNRNDYEQSWQFYQNRRIDIPSGDIYPIRPMPIRMEPVLMDVAYAESAVEMVSMKAAPAMKVARVDLMQTPVYVDQIVYPETCYGCGIMPEYPAYNWEFSGLSLVGQVEFLAALIEEMFADAGSSLIKKEKGNPFLTVNKQTFEKELNRVKRPVVFRAAADQVAFARPVEFLVKDATAPRTKLALPSETRVEAAPVRNYFDDRVKRSNGRGDKKKSRKYHEPLKFNRLSKNLVKATQASVRRAKDEQAFYSLAAVSRPVLAAVMPLHEMAKAMQPQGIVMQLRQMLAESAVEEPFFENFENTEEEETA